MNEETFKKARALKEEISETERSLDMYEHLIKSKNYGLEIRLQDSINAPRYKFKIPKDSTDLILSMSLNVLENKLNKLKKEFDEL